MSQRPSDDRSDSGGLFNFFQNGPEEFGEAPPELLRSLGGDATEWEDEVVRILDRALGETPKLCPHCNGICPDHAVRLRDGFMGRAEVLSTRLLEGLTLYRSSRKFGLSEPEELIQEIYDLWQELFVLYPLAEPQEHQSIIDLLAEGDLPGGEPGA